MKIVRIVNIVLLCLLLTFPLLAAPDRNSATWGTASTGNPSPFSSGSTVQFQDSQGTVTNQFEISITGTAPATATVTVAGCMRSGTCSATLSSSTATASSILSPTSAGPYDYYNVTVTWTGGDSTTKFVVNRTGATARIGGSGGASGPVATGLSGISGLVAEYRMTDTGTTSLLDSSGNGNNGTFPGSTHNPTRVASGSNNIGLLFTGSSAQTITLPSALNSCTTYLFAYNLPAFTATSASPAGMLAQATAQGGGSIYAIGSTGIAPVSTNVTQYDLEAYDYSGGAGGTRAESNGQGSHVWIFASGSGASSLDHMYLDGQEPSLYTLQANPSLISNGSSNWQLGGATTFTAYFTGTLYYFACWNRQLAPSEAGQANNVVTEIMNQRLITMPSIGLRAINGAGSGQDVIVCDGDSIMFGTNDTTNSLQQFCLSMVLTNSPSFSVYIPATAAATMAGNMYPNGWGIDNYYNQGASRNIVVQNAGHNDAGNFQQIVGATAGFCRDRRKMGWRCGIVTEVSNGGTNNTRTAYLRQHWREYSDFLVDWSGDPTIGCNTCNGSFVGPHPNVWETYTFQQYYLQRAINRIAGPQDLTSATTYSASAVAANTVTASTDGAQIGTTGQSIATYTFAANAFTVGQLVTCTGITPAGYNTTIMVQTSTATQITGVIPTNGLAAGSVFGSCTAPQIEDQVFNLNVSAGTFNIGTACAFTGQRLTFKNISAGSATIGINSVPNESAETIDGAATITAASNQTRILESILTTPTTPQCGWKVIQ